MADKYQDALDKITLFENEMRRAGMWQDAPLNPEQYDFERAFAMDTMAYSQWLQFVFVPRVHEFIKARGQFPSPSSVGTQAIREFDGVEEASELVSMLCRFDGFIGSLKSGAQERLAIHA